jgi:hypothetical protein
MSWIAAKKNCVPIPMGCLTALFSLPLLIFWLPLRFIVHGSWFLVYYASFITRAELEDAELLPALAPPRPDSVSKPQLHL